MLGKLLGLVLLASSSTVNQQASSSPLATKKVGVKEVVLDSPVSELHWCGEDHREVLLRTRKGQLYRSDDFGENWKDVTEDIAKRSTDPKVRSPTVTSLVSSPASPQMVLAITSERQHFISEDAGITWRAIKHSGSIHSYVFHPSKPQIALLSTWTDACDAPEKSTSSSPCKHMLYATRDAGKTFTEVSAYVVQFGWGSKAHKQESRIYFSHFRYTSGDQPRLTMWTPGVDFSYSDDYGYTTNMVVDQGNKFLISGSYIFVAKLKDPAQQTVTLEVSNDGARKFKTARLPVSIDERSYTVLDTSEGGVIIHVNHGKVGKDQQVGNIYVSDAEGIRFALSLPGNLRSDGGECEFHKVLSMEGAYLANMWDEDSHATRTVELDDDGEIADAEVKYSRHYDKKTGKEESYVKTVITLDKGGRWYYLTAPKVDSLNNPIDCGSKDCNLHLHGLLNTRLYAPFYSNENAVGLIIGTGNVGPYLRYEKDEVNTYLSRDGGRTWSEIHKGAYIYEFGDHGGLIVMADDTSKSKQVVFSWNEGKSWFDFDVSALAFDIDNIVTEPNSISTKFIMYGSRGDTGVVYHLDFGSLNQPLCNGIMAIGTQASDYEYWTPRDFTGGEESCILGKEVSYVRRKQNSECFNGEILEKPTHKKVCQCTMDDYMCELGFSRNVGSYECLPSDIDNVYLPEEIQCSSSGWFMADAYRKVLGDVCVGGFQPTKVQVPCPPTSPFSKGAILVFVVVILAIGAMALLTYASDNERTRKFLEGYGINVESVRAVRYATLTGAFKRGWGTADDDFDRDAPQLVTVAKTSNDYNYDANFDRAPANSDLIAMDGVRMRAGGAASAVSEVPRLQMPRNSNNNLTELNSFP